MYEAKQPGLRGLSGDSYLKREAFAQSQKKPF